MHYSGGYHVPPPLHHHYYSQPPPPSVRASHYSQPPLPSVVHHRKLSRPEAYKRPDMTGPTPNKYASSIQLKSSIGCTCKKSKCLKLYCQCFSAQALCSDLCSCRDCNNSDVDNKERKAAIRAILERNPAAFEPKAQISTSSTSNPSKGTSTVGCRCVKSYCLKKYCECYSKGLYCSKENCLCVNCCNLPEEEESGDNRKLPPKSSSKRPDHAIRPVNIVMPQASMVMKQHDTSESPLKSDFKSIRSAPSSPKKPKKTNSVEESETTAAAALMALLGSKPTLPKIPLVNTISLGSQSANAISIGSCVTLSKSFDTLEREMEESGYHNDDEKKAAKWPSPPHESRNPSPVERSGQCMEVPVQRPVHVLITGNMLKNSTLPKELSFRKICSRCGRTRGAHGELGFGNRCPFNDCARCLARNEVHVKFNMPMGFRCCLTEKQGAVPGASERYDQSILSLTKDYRRVSNRKKVRSEVPQKRKLNQFTATS